MRPIPGRRKRHTQVVIVPPLGRVVRYKVDAVGNDLKLAGNAVTPPVMTWITGRLLQALEAAA